MLIQLMGQTGIPLDRWHDGLIIMLEKKPGVIYATRLRAIILMEADFNFYNKQMFGSRLLHIANKYQLLMTDNAGGKNNMAAWKIIFRRRLLFDASQLRRTPAVIFPLDTAKYYDRISHHFLSLVLQAYGSSVPSISTMILTIQLISFYFRTAFGDSYFTFDGTQLSRMQGLCQGNGSAPAAWMLISFILLRHHRDGGHGARLKSAMSATILYIIALMSVDDTVLVAFRSEDEHYSEVICRAQRGVDSWNSALQVTGGTLKTHKSFFYVLDY
jgi:hypothetical protein